jgi:FdhD protein
VVLNLPADGLRERLQRNFVMSSSCGVCGKTTIDSLRGRIEPVTSRATIAASTLLALPARMRAAQPVFAATGGLHAAALFGVSGARLVIREDIGRHNAVDKVVGWAFTRGLVPLGHSLLIVSGRASFEIVQKAAAAGVPIVAAVSAPSSLAAELADEMGITLIGFLRDQTFNVYTHPARICA